MGIPTILRGNIDAGDIVMAEDTVLVGDSSSDGVATTGMPLVATGTITTAQLLAIRATPITVIAAPGAAKMISVITSSFHHEVAGTPVAYVEPDTNNLVLEYADGTDITGAIEVTGFLTVTNDEWITEAPTFGATTVNPAATVNQAVQIFQTGAAELTTGTGDMHYAIVYHIVDIA
jgi:hypothetical protein